MVVPDAKRFDSMFEVVHQPPSSLRHTDMFTSKSNVSVGLFASYLLQSDPQYLLTVTAQ